MVPTYTQSPYEAGSVAVVDWPRSPLALVFFGDGAIADVVDHAVSRLQSIGRMADLLERHTVAVLRSVRIDDLLAEIVRSIVCERRRGRAAQRDCRSGDYRRDLLAKAMRVFSWSFTSYCAGETT